MQLAAFARLDDGAAEPGRRRHFESIRVDAQPDGGVVLVGAHRADEEPRLTRPVDDGDPFGTVAALRRTPGVGVVHAPDEVDAAVVVRGVGVDPHPHDTGGRPGLPAERQGPGRRVRPTGIAFEPDGIERPRSVIDVGDAPRDEACAGRHIDRPWSAPRVRIRRDGGRRSVLGPLDGDRSPVDRLRALAHAIASGRGLGPQGAKATGGYWQNTSSSSSSSAKRHIRSTRPRLTSV